MLRVLPVLALAIALVLAVLPWVLLGDVVGREGSLKLGFEDQRVLLEKLGVDGGYSFYVVALTTCPWCALQLKFFSNEFPGAYGYCYIDVDLACREVLERLALESRGLIAGVPTTIVIRDGGIVAVIVGYRGDRSFWEQVARLEPSEEIPVNPALNPQVRVKTALSITILALGALIALALHFYGKGRRRSGRGRR